MGEAEFEHREGLLLRDTVLPWRWARWFDGAAALEVAGDEPAEDGPEEPNGPAGEDIAGIMNAKVNAAEPDEEGEKSGNADDVGFLAAGSDEAGNERAERQVYHSSQ